MTAITRRIQASEATVKTAVVEIKALTIGKRQVTQAVFKQLLEEPVIDEKTCQFRGVPWGTVNYHGGSSCSSGDHLHVVWQTGGELRRDTVQPQWPLWRSKLHEIESLSKRAHSLGHLLLAQRVLAGWRPKLDEKETRYGIRWHADRILYVDFTKTSWCQHEYPEYSHYFESFPVLDKALQWDEEQARQPREQRDWSSEQRKWVLKMETEQEALERATKDWKQIEDSLRERCKSFCSAFSLPDDAGLPHLHAAMEKWIAEDAECKRLTSEWQTRYSELRLLDQLFIAV